MSLSKIRKIATEVRKRAVIHAVWSSDLSEWCGICSFWIFKKCKAAGIKDIQLAVNDQHAFLYWRVFIIDVTATQFGQRTKVIIKKILNKSDIKEYWQIHSLYDNEDSIRRMFRKWPSNQRPFNIFKDPQESSDD